MNKLIAVAFIIVAIMVAVLAYQTNKTSIELSQAHRRIDSLNRIVDGTRLAFYDLELKMIFMLDLTDSSDYYQYFPPTYDN